MTPTKAELEKINKDQKQEIEVMDKLIQDQDVKIGELQTQLTELMAMMSDQKAAVPAEVQGSPADVGGWLIETPVQEYSGMTAKVRFMNGKAVVAVNEPEAALKLHKLQNDFGYKVSPLDERELKQYLYEIATGVLLEPEKSAAEKLVLPQIV